MCAEAVASSSKDTNVNMAAGYFWSILAMMSAPFLIVAVVTLLIVRAIRRARLDQ